jgi:hypothetical protein
MTIQRCKLYVGAKCNTHIMTLIHTIYGREMQYLHGNLKMHTICGWQNAILALRPYYLWEAKILNPYIKHGTFLVEFDDHIKTIPGD